MHCGSQETREVTNPKVDPLFSWLKVCGVLQFQKPFLTILSRLPHGLKL